jgi:hypothetical protein
MSDKVVPEMTATEVREREKKYFAEHPIGPDFSWLIDRHLALLRKLGFLDK